MQALGALARTRRRRVGNSPRFDEDFALCLMIERELPMTQT